MRSDLQSDCAPLNGLVEALLVACPRGAVRALRDATVAVWWLPSTVGGRGAGGHGDRPGGHSRARRGARRV
jgi:hypothetical protein